MNSLFGVVHTTPVGHYNAIKAPFITKNIFKQTLVVTSVLSLIKIIRAHNRPCSTFLNSRFKSRQVYFIKSTITQLHIGGMTVELLIVQCIMLHTGSYPILLYTFDVRNHHSGGQIRVFSHILEVTSVQGSTVDIHTGPQQDVFLAVTCLFTDTFSIKMRHFGIPCSRKTRQCRIGNTGIVCPSCLIPFIPQHFRTDTVRTVGSPYFGNSEAGNACRTKFRLCMNHLHLFFKGHPVQCIFHSLFDRLTSVQIHGLLRKGRQRSYHRQAK